MTISGTNFENVDFPKTFFKFNLKTNSLIPMFTNIKRKGGSSFYTNRMICLKNNSSEVLVCEEPMF